MLSLKDSISKEGKLHGVIANSGCANAVTGEQGLKDAYEMRKLATDKFGVSEHLFAVASTGVIGELLNMDKMAAGIQMLQPTDESETASKFETAIMTTDLVPKHCAFEAFIDGKKVSMGGAAKGSGMIHPNMATMLGFITTDAVIDSADLLGALREVTNDTFNQITVDGDTSTNDMVLVMANGKAGNERLTSEHPEWPVFVELLKQTSETLAKKIARDGEGRNKTDRSKCTWDGNESRSANAGENCCWIKPSQNSSIWCRCELGKNYCGDGSKWCEL